jgi:hypothetical protein
MLVVTGTAMIVIAVVMPSTAVGEKKAATQGQNGEQGNQHCDSTEHLKILMVGAAMKPKLFIGCNMRPRSQRPISREG